MKSPKVSLIIINWNGKEDSAKCIESIRKLDYSNYNIIVVDNASTDGSVKFLRERFPEVTFIENEENLGWTGGNNVGIKYAIENGADYVFVSNNDVVVDKNCLRELVRIAESDPKIGFVGPKIYYYEDPKRLFSVGLDINYRFLSARGFKRGQMDKGQFDEIKEVNWIDDTALLVKKDVIKEVGIYDPEYFMYCEEMDWCFRIRKAGFRILFVPTAIAWHKGAKSSGGGFNSFVAYYKTRNKLLFVRKNLPKYYMITFIPYLAGFILFHSIKAMSERKLDVVFAMIKGVLWHFKHLRLKR